MCAVSQLYNFINCLPEISWPFWRKEEFWKFEKYLKDIDNKLGLIDCEDKNKLEIIPLLEREYNVEGVDVL